MKKTFMKAALATLGLGLVASSAVAVELDVRTGNNLDVLGVPLIANEAYHTVDGVVLNEIGPNVWGPGLEGMVFATIGANSPTSLKFTLPQGEFQAVGKTYKLVAWSDANSDGVVDADETSLPLKITDSTGEETLGVVSADGKEIYFQGPLAPSTGGGLIPAGTRIMIADVVDAADPADPTETFADRVQGGLEIAINGGLDRDSVISMSVTETWAIGGGGEDTDSDTFARMTNQFALCPATPLFDGIIDSEENKLQFTEETDASFLKDDTNFNFVDYAETGQSVCNGVDLTAVYFAEIDPADGDAFGNGLMGSLTSSVDNQAITANIDLEVQGNGAPDMVWNAVAKAWQGVVPVVGLPNAPQYTLDMVATVANVDAIDPRTFDYEVTNVAVEGFFDFSYEAYAGKWSLGEGFDSLIAYFPINFTGYTAFWQATNRSSTEANVDIKGYCTNTATGDKLVRSENVGTIGVNEHKTFTTADVIAALELTDDPYQCAIEVTSDAPAAMFQIGAIQIGPDGRTATPVYNLRTDVKLELADDNAIAPVLQ